MFRDQKLAEKMRFSYSRINTWLQCPAKFKNQYIKGIKTDLTGIEAFRGNAIHYALQKYFENEAKDLEVLLSYYRLHWSKNDKRFLNPYGHEVRDVILDGQKALEYQHRIFSIQAPNVLAVELKLEYKINGYDFLSFVDRVDARNGHRALVDYKSGSSVPSATQVKHDRQMSMYEIGYRQQEKYSGVLSLELDYMRKAKYYNTKRTQSQLNQETTRIMKDIQGIEEAVEMNHFPYRVNMLCKWCEYSEDCPAWKEQQERFENE